ncbi:MAG: ADP-ribosyl-[dinitrogen reductase] hydrolase [Rhodocyclaceae bacterium]|nr:ADP-ribosyl-[dinitrogen reductase] hydrolase [Rhodocyclaceae bacterium]
MKTSSSSIQADEIMRRAAAAYLGLAIGDALGATVEFMTAQEIRAQYVVHRDIKGGGWLRLKPGQVTDDTTMALALGEAIIANQGRVDAMTCARAFDAWMRAKPIDIGNTVRRNLLRYRQSGVPCAPPSEHDAGNGAAMRVLPVALATLGQDEDAVAKTVIAQAHITHNNPVSDAASIFLALFVQDAILGMTLPQIYRQRVLPLVAAQPVFSYRIKRLENPSGWVVETMRAVLQAIFDTDGFEECLVDVVNRGGDADTTGAIAGMLAGALYGLASIPPRWLERLDPTIREACKRQAYALIAHGIAAGEH